VRGASRISWFNSDSLVLMVQMFAWFEMIDESSLQRGVWKNWKMTRKFGDGWGGRSGHV
jgi:hypothetical protein